MILKKGVTCLVEFVVSKGQCIELGNVHDSSVDLWAEESIVKCTSQCITGMKLEYIASSSLGGSCHGVQQGDSAGETTIGQAETGRVHSAQSRRNVGVWTEVKRLLVKMGVVVINVEESNAGRCSKS